MGEKNEVSLVRSLYDQRTWQAGGERERQQQGRGWGPKRSLPFVPGQTFTLARTHTDTLLARLLVERGGCN